MRIATSSAAWWEIGDGYPQQGRLKYMLKLQRGDPSTYVDFDSNMPEGIHAPGFQTNDAFNRGDGTGYCMSHCFFLMPEHSHLLLCNWWEGL